MIEIYDICCQISQSINFATFANLKVVYNDWLNTRCRRKTNRLLHPDLNSGCFHHLWPRFHDSNKLQDPSEMLQVLRRLGEGGQKSGLWNLLRRWWREEAGCDGGEFLSIYISNLGNQATDRNPQRQNVDYENPQSNSFDYDYYDYDYMGWFIFVRYSWI